MKGILKGHSDCSLGKYQLEGVLSPMAHWLGVFCVSLCERNKMKVVAVEEFMISQMEYGVGTTGMSRVISRLLE